LGARLLRAKEGISQRDQGNVVMPAQPMTALEVVQPELLFQLAVIHLDPPTRMGDPHPATQTGAVTIQLRQPILARFRFPFRPFDQQPFGHTLRVHLRPPAMRRPDFQRAAGRIAVQMRRSVKQSCLVA